MQDIYLVYHDANARGRPLRNWNPNADQMPSAFDENLGFDGRLRWRHAAEIGQGDRWLYELNHDHSSDQYQRGWPQLDRLTDMPGLLHGLEKGDGWLMVNLSFEAAIPDYIDRIQAYLRDHGIDPRHAIWATGSHDAASQVEDFSLDLRPMTVRASESMSAFWLRDRIHSLPKRRLIKRFICFMRRYRPHRFQLLSQLHRRGLLDATYVSFGRSVEGLDALDAVMAQCGQLPDGDMIMASMRELYPRFPLVLDAVDRDTNLCESQLSDHALPFYMRSGISIVAETTFDSPYRFLSEKSYHPMRYLQPFIVVGPAGSLRALRDDGYQTFGDFWPENYDDMVDHHERMTAVMDVIQDIAGWSDERFASFMRDSELICAFNLDLLQRCHKRRDHVADLSSLWP